MKSLSSLPRAVRFLAYLHVIVTPAQLSPEFRNVQSESRGIDIYKGNNHALNHSIIITRQPWKYIDDEVVSLATLSARGLSWPA